MNSASTSLKFFGLIVFVIFFSGCFKPTAEKKAWTQTRTFAGFSKEFGEPFGIAVKNDEIYVSDGENGQILRIAADGAVKIYAENLDTPSQIAFDSRGDLIVADSGAQTIKKIKPDGTAEIIAGVFNKNGYADGAANNAVFNSPVGVAVDGEKIYVADTYNDKIRLIENGRVTTIAGSVEGFADGAGEQAKFDTPSGLTVTADGKIVVADSNNHRLRVVETDGNVWTLAGGDQADWIDGKLSEARFVQPTAVFAAESGAIFVADGNAVRVIGGRSFPLVETISNDRRGFADGALQAARFNRPSGLAINKNGDLFVADSENQVVRVLTADEKGAEISAAKKNNLRFKPEEFRRAAKPRWTFNPPEAKREIAGTLGEIRGEISDNQDKGAWFHNGLDIAGTLGETARFVRDGKVLKPTAAENFGSLRELLRLGTMGYIHIRLGRDAAEKPFDDSRFLFSRDRNGKLNGVRVPRGAKFSAGEAIGTLNPFNHVHLIAGRTGAEMNALDALSFPGIGDSVPPTIEKISLFDENWQSLSDPENAGKKLKLTGKTRLVVRAYDQVNGNNARRRLGLYRLGYQIFDGSQKPLGETNWTILFDRMPDERAVPFVYAKGSQSGYTPETIFNFIVSNRVEGDDFREDFFDASQLKNGGYILRVFAADYFGNTASKDLSFEVSQ